MLLFIDGFDHYATADITKKWTSQIGTLTIGAAGRRLSGQLRIAANTSYVTKTFASTASWVIGFAYSAATLPTTAITLAELRDAGTQQCELRLNPDGTLSVTRAGVAVTNGTSATALSVGAYYYIEWKVTIADSIAANSCKVRVSNVDVINVAAGQDLKATANAFANQLRIGNTTATTVVGDYDDLYVCDQSGSTNNDFLGDCRVDTQFPNGDGATNNFVTSTGTTHYTLVDESTPNTTDYVDSSTVGDRDLYDFANLTPLAASTVYGVQVSTAANKDDAGSRSVAVTARSGTTNVDGATQALSTSQLYFSSIFEADSASSAWTQTSVDAAQFGIKVAA